jgi:1,4-dihydroxy-2-naphthoate polyprenyltransferase
MKLKYYLDSFRLRTLPLSISGVLLGCFYALSKNSYHPHVFLLALLTTLSLQILSNISNEVGDLEKGTDNDQRLGPIRSAQNGTLTVQNLKNTMLLFVGISIISGIALIWSAFGTFTSYKSLQMLILGALAIVASIKYTFGKKAYGYVGLGDVFVFIFFGLVSTLGVLYLSIGYLPLRFILPASAVGLLSTGVLNVNNMRDIKNDARFKKRTLAVRLGEKRMKIYHLILIFGAFALMSRFAIVLNNGLLGFLFLLTVPIFYSHLSKVFRSNGKDLDGQLKVLSFATLLFSILSGIGSIL